MPIDTISCDQALKPAIELEAKLAELAADLERIDGEYKRLDSLTYNDLPDLDDALCAANAALDDIREALDKYGRAA